MMNINSEDYLEIPSLVEKYAEKCFEKLISIMSMCDRVAFAFYKIRWDLSLYLQEKSLQFINDLRKSSL